MTEPIFENKQETNYLTIMKDIIENGSKRKTRNGVTYSLFGKHMEFDLNAGFPLLTTKKMGLRLIFEELMFFLRGKTDTKLLEQKNINIWKGNTSREFLDNNGFKHYNEGEMGKMYGFQWRHFNGNDETTGIDQLTDVLHLIKTDPTSRRILMTSYNPNQSKEGVLYPCFMENTIVLTNNGYKFIQTVDINDKLMTHTGSFQNITSIQITPYDKGKPLNSITIYSQPHSINVTPEHPFYAKKIGSQPEWIEAKELTNDHYIGIKVNKNQILPEFTFNEMMCQKIDNLDEWFLMGYFLGDGWLNKSSSTFSLVINYNNFNSILKLINRLNYRWFYREYKTHKQCNTIVINDRKMYKILEMFNDTTLNTLIPEWIQDAPIEYIEKFIEGYKTVNGYNNKILKRIEFTTRSKNIALGLQRLFLKTKKMLTINYKGSFEKNSFCCNKIFNKHGSIYDNISSMYDVDTIYNMIYNYEENDQSFFIIEDDYCWVKLCKTIKFLCKSTINVYNFEVKNDHTYCVENLIVHNCHGLTIQFYVDKNKLSCHMYQRSGDWFLGVPFNISSYSLLIHLIALECNLNVGTLHMSFGDVHIYEDHLDVCEKQLKQTTYAFPKLTIKEKKEIVDYEYEDIELSNYKCNGILKAKMIA
jgi:thymidylate synthase